MLGTHCLSIEREPIADCRPIACAPRYDEARRVDRIMRMSARRSITGAQNLFGAIAVISLAVCMQILILQL
jgi:hypothetical protein